MRRILVVLSEWGYWGEELIVVRDSQFPYRIAAVLAAVN
jgi:hypothetical protein